MKAMSFIRPSRMAVGVAAMVFLVAAAATLQPWPFRITALGIATGLLLMTLFPEKPKDFKVGLQRITQVARSISIHDSSIGLHQRWYFDLRLKEESERCRRYGYSMAVVVLKVLPPDAKDSPRGPQPVRPVEAASVVASTVRTIDISTTLAPLEFAACLVHCDQAGAEAAILRLREELSEHETRIGFAIYPDDDNSVESLVAIAQSHALGNNGVEARKLPA